MKIELKNIKEVKSLSEETPCFTATVYIDGKKAGVVSNHGTGGPNNYHPNTLYTRLKAHADTLPTYSAYGMDGLKVDADYLIFEVMEAAETQKAVARALKNRVIFIKADGKVYETRKMTTSEVARLCAAGVPNAVKVLNTMPIEDAVKAYLAAGGQ